MTELVTAPADATPTGTTTFIEAVASAIAAEGVTHAFGLMGAGTIRLTHHLVVDHGVRYHATRHENAVVGAAEGSARATGDVGVGMVTWGPALTNCITALVTADRGASPLVLVAADSWTLSAHEEPFSGGSQAIDQERITDAIDVPTVVATPDNAYAAVADAFALARRRSGPVVLKLPAELEIVPVSGGAPVPAPRGTAAREIVMPADDDVERVASLLRHAERPVVLGGLGVWRCDGQSLLAELADRTGAVLATSLRAAGMFREHPASVGVAGGFAPPAVGDLLRSADLVVAFGASLNLFTTMKGTAFGEATVVQVVDDRKALGAIVPVDVEVHADAYAFAEALLAAVPEDRPASSIREDADALGDRRRFAFPDMSTPGALDPRAVCRRLNELLPADRAIVSDSGQFCMYPIESMDVWSPDALLWMMDFGAVGSGLGPALGTASARPERPTVLFIGDGGLLMTVGDLDLAVRDRLPLLVVCLNDGAYGAEIYHLRNWGLPLEHAQFATPDLAAIARSFGCDAERITDLPQLDALADRLARLDGPLFLDVVITGEELPSPLRQHV